MAGLEVRGVPCGPLGGAWNARVDDWIEDGQRIIRLSREYRRHYRATVCVRCAPGERVRRRCAALTPGCDRLSCSHMDRAFYSKYRDVIRARQWSHPLMVRIRLNAELEAGRRCPPLRPAAADGPGSGAPLRSRRGAA